MEEKIKIYLTQETLNVLLKDMELFEFFKKDGNLNKNAFLNTLIVNYYESYQKNVNDLYTSVQKTLRSKCDCAEGVISDITYDILQLFDIKVNRLEDAKFDALIALKPTKHSSNVIHYIQQCLLQGSTMSNYFRNMLTSYALLPMDKRERIIFKENYELIKDAIRYGRKIYFTMTKNASKHITSPYALANSKEELFNYVIAEYEGRAYSFRLSRMQQIIIQNEESEFTDDVKRLMDKMIQYGPQFAISDDKEICVELSEHGLEMYKKMYLHRPKPVRIEDRFYYFDCSNNQILQYFFRFGRHAYVMYPKELNEEMERNYQMGLRMYQRKKHK